MTNFLVIAFSLLIALILEIIPLPVWAVWMKPEWVLLMLIYWSLVFPNRVGVSVAFVLGLIMDLLTGTLLGQHALIFVLIIYFVSHFCLQIRLCPIWQQIILIGMIVFVYQTFQFWIWGVGLTSSPTLDWFYWFPCVTSAFVWPWVYALLSRYQSHYNRRGNFLE